MHIAIIGAGAAGCFAAIEIKRRLPKAEVTVFESGQKALAKVAITGGGRCNLTNSFEGVGSVESVYPRGSRLMKRLLKEFSHKDAYRWFEEAGVRLVTQDDHCVFPVSQDAMEIVDTLLGLMKRHGVMLKSRHRITKIEPMEKHGEGLKYMLYVSHGNGLKSETYCFDAVVVTTGGSPRLSGLSMLEPLHLEFVSPVPSLFSFCLEKGPLTELMGTVVEDVAVNVVGTKMKAEGPLLITHWGLSGPAILKLSSYAARYLNEHDYRATISVNWFGATHEEDVAEELSELAVRHAQKQLQSVYPTRFNSRLWSYFIQSCGLRLEQRWAELGRKSFNRLASRLTSFTFDVIGKNRFKDEFVTCGGVSLNNVNPSTLECRQYKNLYFAGEVLDIDAITGGFNLQAAWTTAYVVAKGISASAATASALWSDANSQ
ncbi:MAG: aminoacetone oxidase family FAD-binding enzyme [Prevotella sp.]